MQSQRKGDYSVFLLPSQLAHASSLPGPGPLRLVCHRDHLHHHLDPHLCSIRPGAPVYIVIHANGYALCASCTLRHPNTRRTISASRIRLRSMCERACRTRRRLARGGGVRAPGACRQRARWRVGSRAWQQDSCPVAELRGGWQDSRSVAELGGGRHEAVACVPGMRTTQQRGRVRGARRRSAEGGGGRVPVGGVVG